MKRKFYIYVMAAAFILAGAAGCDESLETYNSHNGLHFQESEAIYSFVYADPGVTREMFMVEVLTMGNLSDHERRISIEQVETEGDDAVPGVHYVAFDDPSLRDLYVIPAGANKAMIPVVLLRDKSLETKVVTLKIAIKKNDDFGIGLPERSNLELVFTDQLSQPYHWNGGATLYYFGVYGVAKHRWLIETTGEKWDDDYWLSIGFFNSEGTSYLSPDYDPGFLHYYCGTMIKKLAEYNAQRALDGKGPLAEEDGTVVSFFNT